LGGLEYAIRLGWFNYKTFNLAEYEHYEKIENGDLNWILPSKFVAFSSPSDKTMDKYGVLLPPFRTAPSLRTTMRPSSRN
jgi:cell division cycle 14